MLETLFHPFIFHPVLRVEGRRRLACLLYRELAGHTSREPAGTSLPRPEALWEPRLVSVLAKLRDGASRHQVAAWNIRRLAGLDRIARVLDGNGIPWAVLKGMEHLHRLYGSLDFRLMSDIDLLVSPDRFAEAIRVVGAEGFSMFEPATSFMAHAVAVRGGGVTADLHCRLSRRCTTRASAEEMLANIVTSNRFGSQVKILTPLYSFLAHALLLGRHGFAAWDLGALRCVEIALLHDLLSPSELEQAEGIMRRWRAARLYRRTIALVRTVKGNAPPAWLDPAALSAELVSSRRRGRGAAVAARALLMDRSSDAIAYVGAEFAVSLCRLLSCRRMGRLPGLHRARMPDRGEGEVASAVPGSKAESPCATLSCRPREPKPVDDSPP